MVNENFDVRPVTTRAEAEALLDAGKLYVKMNNGRYWRARRSGMTKTWKTRPEDFRVPFKVGLKLSGQITPKVLASLLFFTEA